VKAMKITRKVKLSKKPRLNLGLCNQPYGTCAWCDAIDGEQACRKPPIFPKCKHQADVEEVEWQE